MAARDWRRAHGSGLARAEAAGYADATLWVLRGNRRARDFYEASGFVPDGAAKIDTNAAGISFDEVRYRRPLE